MSLNLKKGISPLIATVLLIGFTIIIIALVIFWSQTFVRETAEKEGELSALKLQCEQQVDINIMSASQSGGNLLIEVENTGLTEIKGFQFRIINNKGEADSKDSFENVPVGSIKRITAEGAAFASELDMIPALRPEGRGAPLVPCTNQHKVLDIAYITGGV